MEIERREALLGYHVFREDLDACAAEMVRWIRTGSEFRYLACVNPHSLNEASRDRGFSEALRDAAMLVPDGIGVVWASRLLGGRLRQRITGFDVFTGLSRALDELGGFSYYFVGASASTLDKIRGRLSRDYPRIAFAGACSPSYGGCLEGAESSRIIEGVNRAAPDVLWVGMTAPKQEKWLHENRSRLQVRAAGAIGAVFDFYAGVVQRPSERLQAAGLEWLGRLAREPRRLWRRNLVSAPKFVGKVLREKFSR